jgi:eukaryotic-like serine/threonine-protein kinase
LSDALVSDTLERLRLLLAERYAVERELGRGGMATVYLAQDVRHDRQVAIKVLRPELSASLGSDRFNREIKVAAGLQHPHILGLYDSGAAEGLLYYVMPFVEGESLRDKLDREKQLGVEDAIRLVCECAEALNYAHSRGVIHRDIKPENVMLSGGHALVADFGIAKAFSEAGAQKLTETGMAVGTPYYMSPEQAMGSEIDGRADQYSLGCVLYELLAGQPPFTGPTPMAILARHSLERVPRLTIVRHSIPEAVELVVLRALEKVPADRYATMGAFAEALRGADMGRLSTRTAARPVPTESLRALAKPVPRWRRALPWAIGAVAIVLVGVGGWLGWRRWGAAKQTATNGVPAGADPNRLAVLYFQRRGGSDSLQYLADGLTEALIHELSQVKGLQVISRNGVAPYKSVNVSPDSIGRALNVGTLVSGTLEQSGDRLRVTVALVNPATGAEIGTKTLERPRTEIFALQDDLAKEVSIFLRQQVGQEVKLQESRVGTKNAAAWELVEQAEQEAKAVETLLAAADTASAARRLVHADSLLGKAEALDPNWPPPAVQRGWLAYRRLDLAGGSDQAYFNTWLATGLEHAETALKLKPDDPEALELRGTLRYWQWVLNLGGGPAAAAKLVADAESDLRRAVAQDPNRAFAWAMLSHLLMRKSETAEGKLAALRAYEADPYLNEAPTILWRLFSSSLDLEDGVEATRWCDEAYRRFPGDPRFLECQISLLALPGQKPDVSKAWQLLEQNVKLYPPNQREFRRRRGQLLVAMALVRAGLPDSARSVALRSRSDATVDPTRELVYIEALLRNMLGDRDEALRLISVYLATNPQERPSMANDDTWWWRGLREDPRYRRLVGIEN